MTDDLEKPRNLLKEAAVAYQVATPVLIPPSGDDLFYGDGKYVSEEDYFKYFYEFSDVSYEWNNGILEAKPMSDAAKVQMYIWFVSLIREFLKTNPIARYTALEMGFRMEIQDPDVKGAMKSVIRKPDLGIVLNSNPIALGDHDKTYQGICDLCVESLSDSTQKEIERDTVEKKREYMDAKVKEYFILDDKQRHMLFYRLTELGTYVEIKPDADGVVRSRVLDGFQFRVDDLLRQPSFEAIAHDPIYKAYLLLEFQEVTRRAEQELQRAEQEFQRAEQEKSRAEQERSRADRLAKELRRLGHDPDALVN